VLTGQRAVSTAGAKYGGIKISSQDRVVRNLSHKNLKFTDFVEYPYLYAFRRVSRRRNPVDAKMHRPGKLLNYFHASKPVRSVA
jgi:hypothetical protein